MTEINIRQSIIDWLVANGGDNNGTKMQDFGFGEFYPFSELQLGTSQVFIGPVFDEIYDHLEPEQRPIQVGVLVEHNLILTDEQYLAIELFELSLPKPIRCEVGYSLNDDLWLIRDFENTRFEIDTLDKSMTELVGVSKKLYQKFGHLPNAPLIKLREVAQ